MLHAYQKKGGAETPPVQFNPMVLVGYYLRISIRRVAEKSPAVSV